MAREIYYYLRDGERKPVVTVCLLEAENERARGVSICSKKDNPSKRSGKKIAKDRAKYALKKKGHHLPIEPKGGEAKILESVNASPSFFDFLKAAYNPEINHIEMQRMGIAI